MMQLAWGDEVVLIDPLAPAMAEALTLLGPLLGGGGPVKVIHDVGFDARLLAEVGLTLGNVHDTALMAQWLERTATGLASLAKAELGVTLDKSLQAADWAARPLTESALHYLANDVVHLFALDDKLFTEAQQKEIVLELDEEIAYRLGSSERAAREPDPRPAYVRMKGLDTVAPGDLKILRRLAEARSQEAERLDAPEGELVATAVLLAIARARPTTLGALGRIRSPIARKDSEGVGRALLEAVRLGVQDVDIPDDDRKWFNRPRIPPADIKARRDREARMSSWRKAEARARGVSEQVVLPGHCVTELVAIAPTTAADLSTTAGLGAFRVARYGEAILSAIHGPPDAPPADTVLSS